MSEPNYGAHTVSRPLLSNGPTMPENSGWTETTCPYCGAPCWQMATEAKIIQSFAAKGGATAACTMCTFQRAFHQREMDQKRHDREHQAPA